MSTNIDQPGIPDVNLLQELANQFFKAIPGTAPSAGTIGQPSPLSYDPLASQGNVGDLKSPPSSLQDPHFAGAKTPVSVAGGGVSPSAINSVNAIDLKNQEENLTSPDLQVQVNRLNLLQAAAFHHQLITRVMKLIWITRKPLYLTRILRCR
ncbi:MAG: hypothetical protein WDO16_14355 [Bacteroidota bacterium]